MKSPTGYHVLILFYNDVGIEVSSILSFWRINK